MSSKNASNPISRELGIDHYLGSSEQDTGLRIRFRRLENEATGD